MGWILEEKKYRNYMIAGISVASSSAVPSAGFSSSSLATAGTVRQVAVINTVSDGNSPMEKRGRGAIVVPA